MPTKNIMLLVVLVKRWLRRRRHLILPVVTLTWGALLAVSVANYVASAKQYEQLLRHLAMPVRQRTFDVVFG
jgi:hypothetical protein